MSYGTAGSTLNDELNRLANGGTYPAITDYLDQAAAAQKWAVAKGKTLGKVSDLVGVLNIIASISGRDNWLDLAGVCNNIASTTGLEPAAALREVAS